MTAAAAGSGRLGRAALVVGSTRGSLVAPRPQFSPLVSLVDPAVSLGPEPASLVGVTSAAEASRLKTQLADLVLGLVASMLVESRGECSSFEPILSSAAALQSLSSDLIRREG